MSRDVDEPGADAQRRLGRQADRARHPGTAAVEQQPAARALVRGAPARGQRALELRAREPRERGRKTVGELGREAEVGELERPRVVAGPAEVEPLLQADEGHGRARADRLAERQPQVRVQTARNVEREDRQAARIRGGHGGCVVAFERSVHADAEQRVDDHRLRRGDSARDAREAFDRDSGGDAFLERVLRVAFELLRRRDREDSDLEGLCFREPREHEAVPAVVAGAAEHDDGACVGPAPPQHAQRLRARAGHQLEARDRKLRARASIELAHLARAVHRDRQRLVGASHRRDYTGP